MGFLMRVAGLQVIWSSHRLAEKARLSIWLCLLLRGKSKTYRKRLPELFKRSKTTRLVTSAASQRLAAHRNGKAIPFCGGGQHSTVAGNIRFRLLSHHADHYFEGRAS